MTPPTLPPNRLPRRGIAPFDLSLWPVEWFKCDWRIGKLEAQPSTPPGVRAGAAWDCYAVNPTGPILPRPRRPLPHASICAFGNVPVGPFAVHVPGATPR